MNSNNTSLVPFGSNPSSNVGKPMFSRLVASMVILTPFVFGVVIGLLLSDGYLQFLNSRTAVNVALGISQSLAHFKYLWFVFTILAPYCISYPKFRSRTQASGTFYALDLRTRSYPALRQFIICFTSTA
ncbi:hypothetical protein BC936DRAFT_144719 [Jimgerdemannia flammicorona]|uniref:Homing endonuclease LAGLIDADG domain-containing protein n=1 Tax=Jimgerdemannia flammicorona TaxID=994334 RepID=A0A433DBX0_9FUNG|nr:hypothetical protein BC936DRAFT_144719 [Jimgerdemannia flammicorona]